MLQRTAEKQELDFGRINAGSFGKLRTGYSTFSGQRSTQKNGKGRGGNGQDARFTFHGNSRRACA